MADTLPFRRIVNVTHYSHHHGNLNKEAADQKFKVGNLLEQTNGECTAVTAATAQGRYLLAARDSENTENPNPLPVVTPQPNMIFEITAGGAASTEELLQAGKQYGYAVEERSGYGYLDLAAAGTAVFELVNHNGSTLAKNGGAVGDTNVRVYARLLAQ